MLGDFLQLLDELLILFSQGVHLELNGFHLLAHLILRRTVQLPLLVQQLHGAHQLLAEIGFSIPRGTSIGLGR